MLRWRERPWTIWVVVTIGVGGNVVSLVTDRGVANLVMTAISFALLAGLWRGNPGVRLYYILALLLLVVLNLIAFLKEPSDRWTGLAITAAMFTLLLAPPTHRWAERREQERDQRRSRTRL